MTLSAFEWFIVCGVAGIVVSIITYFLKRTMATTDAHGKDIAEIKQNYVTKDITDEQSKDVNEIKRTYVTKTELKEIKTEMRDETSKLSEGIAEIKNNYLTKDDYYRKQIETDRKLDRIYELLLKEKGGAGNG